MIDNSAPDDELATWQAMHDAFVPWVEQLNRDTRTLARSLGTAVECSNLAAAWVAEHALLKQLRDAWPYPGQGCIGLGLVEDTQHAANMAATAHGLMRQRQHREQHLLMLSLLFAGQQPATGSTAPMLCSRVAAAIDRLTAPGRPPGSEQRSEHSPNCRKRRAAMTGCAAAVAPPTTNSVERLLSTG